jgi:hypothetical protein
MTPTLAARGHGRSLQYYLSGSALGVSPGVWESGSPGVRLSSVWGYRGSRAIRRAIFELRHSFLANYIQKMVKFSLNYY